ncbi:Hypothetical predicted protein [Lecanosticta acicola]|uniref:PBP domain-containing protein n=1 Tax=Lecanosticta acicola TaxID=111012 RepID=A0AAI8YU99_9PEZI|nr:Hypothetical predicted protein [Lecanosticta acicola]
MSENEFMNGSSSLSPSTSVSDPWISRFASSALQGQSNGPAGSDSIITKVVESYGNPSKPICFNIGNGGAGYTGILKSLTDAYISERQKDFRVGWVPNHSRHSQIALLANVVQLALTYEPENEDLAVQEGWCSKVGRVFNDHFLLAGPAVDVDSRSATALLRSIAESGRKTGPGSQSRAYVFLSRGDGSATFAKENSLFRAAQVDMSAVVKTHPCTPYEALVQAEKEQAFLLTDRATFLTAKRDHAIPSLRVHVEGGEQLLNPCSALVRSPTLWKDRRGLTADDEALAFARWLCGPLAQSIVAAYGSDWNLGKPLFTVAAQDDFVKDDLLATS